MREPRSSEAYKAKVRSRVCANLKGARAELRWSQEFAAEKAGFSLQYLQRIERGIVNIPLDTLARISLAYGVDVATFFIIE